MAWQLRFRIGHSYFGDDKGRIAVADNSMRNMLDPATADDGLTLLDKSRAVIFKNDGAAIPIVHANNDFGLWTYSSWHEGVEVVKQFGLRAQFDKDLRELEEIMHRERI